MMILCFGLVLQNGPIVIKNDKKLLLFLNGFDVCQYIDKMQRIKE